MQQCPHSPWRGGCEEAHLNDGKCFKPLHDEPYEAVLQEYLKCPEDFGHERPDPQYYRPDWPEDVATWWQLYENVSEGTPVSPAFATSEELIDYLCAHGDFWQQRAYGGGGGVYTRKAAESVVRSGYAPTFIARSSENGFEIIGPQNMD